MFKAICFLNTWKFFTSLSCNLRTAQIWTFSYRKKKLAKRLHVFVFFSIWHAKCGYYRKQQACIAFANECESAKYRTRQKARIQQMGVSLLLLFRELACYHFLYQTTLPGIKTTSPNLSSPSLSTSLLSSPSLSSSPLHVALGSGV